MDKAVIIIFSLILVMAVGLGGCITSNSPVAPAPTPTITPTPVPTPIPVPTPPAEKLEILSHSMSGGRGEFVKPVVKGTAKNISSSTINAYVYVKFYDASGALLGTGADTITSLDPGETWSFKVTYSDIDRDKVYSYKIKPDSPF